MDVNQGSVLLGGLTPSQFMRRHWQKKPLLVRGALPGFMPLLSRAALFRLAARKAVESRLIVRDKKGWLMKHGPFSARGLPALSQRNWSLLVQGVDLHDEASHGLLQRFRFVPDARLDDLMISFATPGGGVGPHFDSYDVFLLQASGRRRWKIGKQKDLTLQPGAPLKILQNFTPEQEFVLEAGDMLYLPPRYAHDGIAEAAVGMDGKPADCMTYSVGFRAPARSELAAQLLHRLAEFNDDASEAAAGADDGSDTGHKPRRVNKGAALYRDPGQAATDTPAALPPALQDFARDAVIAALQDQLAVGCALGECMTTLKPSVWFEAADADQFRAGAALRLHGCTRMMYDANHIFINGESHRAKGADARLMQRLADRRGLSAHEMTRASAAARELLADWHAAGWVHVQQPS